MTYEETKKLSAKDAETQLAQAQAQLQEIRFKLGASQVKDVREVRVLRRRIAHLLTHVNASANSNTN